jgi:thiamine biosynthesis lipoprotein
MIKTGGLTVNFFRLLAIAVIICVTLSVAACKPGGLAGGKQYKDTQFLMDTIIEITANGPDAEAAVKAAFGEFKRLHDLTNNFDANSQVSRINQNAGKDKVAVDAELVDVISHALAMSAKLDGAFDITVGALTDLWGVGHKGEYVPSQAELDKVLPLVDYRLVRVDTAANTVFLPKQGMKIDLGGVAKGYALNKATEKLKAYGIKSALVNAGGDIRVIGVRPEGSPWRLGVQDPRNSEAIAVKIPMTDWDTVQTSGDYQRFFMREGTRYAHILDPKTGRQPRELTSVTLVYKSVVGVTDIASSGIFVLGVDKGREVLARFPGVEAIMITGEGKVILTPGLQGKVEISSK